MYVCLCHGFTDRDIRRSGANSVGEAYRALGVKPSCCKCVPFVKNLVRANQQTPASAGKSR